MPEIDIAAVRKGGHPRKRSVSAQLADAQEVVHDLAGVVTRVYGGELARRFPALVQAEIDCALDFEDTKQPLQAAKVRQKSRQFLIGIMSHAAIGTDEDNKTMQAMVERWSRDGGKAKLTETTREAELELKEPDWTTGSPDPAKSLPNSE